MLKIHDLLKIVSRKENREENNRILKRVLKINILRHEANLWI